MKWTQETHGGYTSNCGQYSMREYRYYHPQGRTCGPEHACAPYWVGYRRGNGNRITPPHGCTRAQVEQIIEEDKA